MADAETKAAFNPAIRFQHVDALGIGAAGIRNHQQIHCISLVRKRFENGKPWNSTLEPTPAQLMAVIRTQTEIAKLGPTSTPHGRRHYSR